MCSGDAMATRTRQERTRARQQRPSSLAEMERQHILAILKKTRGVIEVRGRRPRLLNLSPPPLASNQEAGIKRQQFEN